MPLGNDQKYKVSVVKVEVVPSKITSPLANASFVFTTILRHICKLYL
jgi:hypothetical protein